MLQKRMTVLQPVIYVYIYIYNIYLYQQIGAFGTTSNNSRIKLRTSGTHGAQSLGDKRPAMRREDPARAGAAAPERFLATNLKVKRLRRGRVMATGVTWQRGRSQACTSVSAAATVSQAKRPPYNIAS